MAPSRPCTDVSLPIREHQVTALIGPSGCGKSTFLRTLNRMNDLIPDTRTEGEAIMDGRNIYDKRSMWSLYASALVWYSSVQIHSRNRSLTMSPMACVSRGSRRNAIQETVERSLQRGGTLGRGQRSLENIGVRALRRSATTPMHCSRIGSQTRSAAHG